MGSCARAAIFIASSLMICVGIAILILGAVAYGKYEVIPDTSKQKTFKNVCRATIGVGAFFTVGGILGILGLCTNSKCLLFIYGLAAFLMFIVLASIGVAALVYKSKNHSDWTNCDKDSLLYDADQFAIEANEYFCQAECPCETGDVTKTLADLSTVASGPIRVQECKGYETTEAYKQYDDIASSMKWIEEHLNCAGICTPSEIYLFSDVNDGIPENSCQEQIKDKIEKYSKQIGGVCLGLGIFFFLALLGTCCAIKKRREDGEFYGLLASERN